MYVEIEFPENAHSSMLVEELEKAWENEHARYYGLPHGARGTEYDPENFSQAILGYARGYRDDESSGRILTRNFRWLRSSGTYAEVEHDLSDGSFLLRLSGRRHSLTDMPGASQLQALVEREDKLVLVYETMAPHSPIWACGVEAEV
ncbi:MAG: hypothetical protein PHV85_00180 [Desulfovibrionaceae bacterium]|nr:hypothetical protein [Desulfovibrionaceae bacterium]